MSKAQEDAQRVSDELRGQCLRSIEQVCEDLEIEDTQELRELIDQEVFECDGCGWWCEISEMSETVDWTCTDCEPDED